MRANASHQLSLLLKAAKRIVSFPHFAVATAVPAEGVAAADAAACRAAAATVSYR